MTKIVQKITEIMPPFFDAGLGTFNKEVLGLVPIEAFQQAIEAPAMVGPAILRRYDPLWGVLENGESAKFKVTLTKTVEVEYITVIEVEAADAESAEKIIDNMSTRDFDWDYDAEYEQNVSVDKIERIE